MSGLFGSSLIKGTRITDFGTTTAEVGIPLPFGYGRAPYDGNVIFCPLPPVEHRHVTRQGKGGVKQESFTYTLSYSISFMKGRCYGYWWVKRNGKVVWTMDPNAPIEDQEYAQKWAEKVNFHYGTADQMPDAVIESYEGAGNVSAFRNLTYFTIEDDDVTDVGGAVPSYEACLIASPPEAYLTSKPYPQRMQEATTQMLTVSGGSLVRLMHEGALQATDAKMVLAATGGDMFVPPPQVIDPDNMEMHLAATGGELLTPPPAEVEDNNVEPSIAPTSGRIAVPPVGTVGHDELDVALAITGGGMGVPAGHRYWRINITANDGSLQYAGFTEVELKTSPGGPDITTTVGTTGAATGSSQVNTSNRYSYAVDDNNGTGWLANGVTGWWRYDCQHADHLAAGGAPLEDVVQVTIRGSWNHPTASPRDFTIDWSDDNITWTTALAVTGETGWTGATDVRTFDL